MILSIAWKNIWRNKTRSSVVIAAFTIGIFSGIFIVAVMVGWVDTRVDNAIGNEVSHIQIHHPEFPENNELKYTIDDHIPLVDSIMQLPEVEAVSARIKILGMASTSGNATGVMINGINPDNERALTDIAASIPEGAGSFFNGTGTKSIVVGEKLAKVLRLTYYELQDVDLGRLSENRKFRSIVPQLGTIMNERFRTEHDFEEALVQILGQQKAGKYMYFVKKAALKYRLRNKIVLSFQSLDGHIAYDAFRVAGIYRTNNSAFDALNVYVLKDEIAPVACFQDPQVNEIAIKLSSSAYVDETALQIRAMAPSLTVDKWTQLLPEARMYTEMMDFYLMIFMVIILLALGFGIVNTMLMAVLERIKELGMLMAIGMNKARVFVMIMLETTFLGLTGALAGMIISYLVVLYSGQAGIDLSRLYSEGLNAIGFGAVIYPSLRPGSYLQVTLLVILTGIIASIYPARKAIKLNPSEALRIDM